MLPTDVHPEEQPSAWEAVGLWAAIFLVCGGFWYAVFRWPILPVFRSVWPLVQPVLQQHGVNLLTAALLAAVVMMAWSIIKEP